MFLSEKKTFSSGGTACSVHCSPLEPSPKPPTACCSRHLRRRPSSPPENDTHDDAFRERGGQPRARATEQDNTTDPAEVPGKAAPAEPEASVDRTVRMGDTTAAKEAAGRR